MVDSTERWSLIATAMNAFVDATADLPWLLQVVATQTAAALCGRCHISTVSEDGSHLVPVPCSDGAPAIDAGLAAALGDVWTHDAEFRVGARLVLPREATGLDPTAAVMFVPMRARTSVLGVLTIRRHGADGTPFDEREQRLAEALASHAALAIAKARLFAHDRREIAERTRVEARLRLLSGVTREFAAATGDYPALVELIARRLGEVLGETCSIRMLSADGTHFATVAGLYHPDPRVVDEWRDWLLQHPQPRDEGVAGRAVATGKAFLIPRITPDELASTMARHRTIIERLEIRSIMAVALRSEGEPIGAAVMTRSDAQNPFTPDDLELLEDLAAHASIALTNSRLFAALNRELGERERMTDRLRLLTELTREFAAATGNYPALLQLVAQRLGEVLGDGCAIRMVAAGGELLEMAGALYHPDPVRAAAVRAVMFARPQRVGEGITGRVIASGQTMFIPVITAQQLAASVEEQYRPIIEQLAMRSLLVVPLRSGGQTIGAIMMTRGDPGHPYTADDRALLEDLASHASIAMTNSRLLETANRELAERKLAEHRLRETEEQLRQTQKMEAIGQLAGGVAHDFNNLLSVILSYASILLAELPEGDPICADLEEIKQAGERAADLTRQLLAFGRRQVLMPQILDLGEIIEGLAKMNHRIIGEDIEYRTVCAAELGLVKADPGHIAQVIMNLVVNARDAMPRGGRLTIETQNVELDQDYANEHLSVTPGPHVMLAVSDTGMGMDKATQQRIFEPFFTTKATGKGTGLGLSTVFGIVKQSGGSIWLYSEPGQGTTFKIYFPRTDEARTAVATHAPLRTLHGTETILLVEDDDQLRSVARGILSRNGYDVLEARNGAEALLLCAKYEGVIHLLLTDVVMPSMGGRELARRLEPLRKDVRVLYMSGYTDDAIVHHGVLDPGIVLLEKPLTPDSLLRKVREVLN